MTQERVERIVAEYDIGARTRKYAVPALALISLIAVAMGLFHIWAATLGLIDALPLRGVHFAFVLALAFLLYPARWRERDLVPRRGLPVPDIVLAVAAAAAGLYVVFFYDQIVVRAGAYTQLDTAMGIVAILLVLEAGRRATGWMMPVLSLVFLLYPFYGAYLPGLFAIRQFSVERVVQFMYLTTEGLFGVATGVSATFLFLFILFGAFLVRTGTGQLFIDLSIAVLGRQTGGPAKVAVVASGLMGTINGSAVANAAGTGVFTIPLMKRVGYSPNFAAGVEAAASTGGQLMPPVMGAAAFIMAEFIGVPYGTIIIAAALPALLYYGGLLVMVHLEAKRHGIGRMRDEDMPSLGNVLGRLHLLLPVAVVLYLLVSGYTPTYAAVAGIGTSMIAPFLRRSTWIHPRVFWDAMVQGARDAVPIAAAVILIGFIIGATTLTGVGLKIAGGIVALGAGNLIFTMVLTMLASMVLGTGLPTTATYIVLATMAAPALVQMGVGAIAAHLFIFYYGIIADLTPPVALAAMPAAGIAGGDHQRASWIASRLALAGFLVPFIFVLNPAMLIIGTPPLDVIRIAIGGTLGVIALGVAAQGYLSRELGRLERLVAFAAALMLIDPGVVTDLAGVVLLAALYLWQRRGPAAAAA
ncbi:MAG: TRAP transporter permease [Acidimicrobiia bacterium]